MTHADILIWCARKELSVQVKHADILIRYARKSMACAPVRRDNPRAIARGLSLRTGAQTMLCLTCTMISSVDLHITEYLVLEVGYLWIVFQMAILELN